jgi:hypothetical protein
MMYATKERHTGTRPAKPVFPQRSFVLADTPRGFPAGHAPLNRAHESKGD